MRHILGLILGIGLAAAGWAQIPVAPRITTSAILSTLLTDETGSGAAVFATSPTLVTPALGAATATSLTDSGLTSGRVTFAGTAGLLADDADLTFATDTLTATKLIGSTSITDTGLTATRLTYAGVAGLLSDSANLTYASNVVTANNPGIAATSTDGLVLVNTTAASSGVTSQWSPRLHFTGAGWKSNATAVSQASDWILENQPITAGAAITSQLSFSYSLAGAAYVGSGYFCSNPGDTVPVMGLSGSCASGTGFGQRSGVLISVVANATNVANININGHLLTAGKYLAWSSGNASGNTSGDVGLQRNAAATLEINNGGATGCATLANCADLKLRHTLASGSAPTVADTSAASCGTTAATIAGSDGAHRITVGTVGGTSCTVTFGTAWTTAPSCIATNETTANLLRATASTTTVIVAGTMVAADKLAVLCVGY